MITLPDCGVREPTGGRLPVLLGSLGGMRFGVEDNGFQLDIGFQALTAALATNARLLKSAKRDREVEL